MRVVDAKVGTGISSEWRRLMRAHSDVAIPFRMNS